MQNGRIYKRFLKEPDRNAGNRFWKIRDPFIKEYVYGKEFG